MTDHGHMSSDSGSEILKRERAVQKHWFDEQPIEKQAEIIKPHFDKAHPTPDSVREAVKRYTNRNDQIGNCLPNTPDD